MFAGPPCGAVPGIAGALQSPLSKGPRSRGGILDEEIGWRTAHGKISGEGRERTGMGGRKNKRRRRKDAGAKYRGFCQKIRCRFQVGREEVL